MSERSEVVVITGASSGIGRATARAYAKRGARLVLASRSEPALETVAEECRRIGAAVEVVPTDVSVEREVRALAAAAASAFGRIDVWVGNAGLFSYGSFEQTPARVFRQILETNLMGQVHGVRAALPYLRRQGGGAIVLVGSLYSRVSSPALSPYITSKWGLLGFAEVMRAELGDSGIGVRVVLPSTIDTPIYEHAANYTGRSVRPLPPASAPERVARAIVRAPGRRRFATSVGHMQRSAVLLHRVLPGFYDRVTRFSKDRVELGESAPPTDGTVFRAPEHAAPVRGGWRSRRRGVITAAVAAVALLVLTRRSERPSPSRRIAR